MVADMGNDTKTNNGTGKKHWEGQFRDIDFSLSTNGLAKRQSVIPYLFPNNKQSINRNFLTQELI